MKSITKNRRVHSQKGIALVEVALAIAILLVAVVGSLSYEYYSAIHKNIADADLTATRTAQLLLEDWKSTGGSSKYKPTNLNLGIQDSGSDNYSDYFVKTDDLPMYITFSYNDIDYDDITEITLRKISVSLNWRQDHKEGERTEIDPLLTLSTYVRTDASGG